MANVRIDLNTDWRPGVDFSLVEVNGYRRSKRQRAVMNVAPVTADDDVTGLRIAHFANLQNGDWVFLTRLLNRSGNAITLRVSAITVRGSVAQTLTIPRDG